MAFTRNHSLFGILLSLPLIFISTASGHASLAIPSPSFWYANSCGIRKTPPMIGPSQLDDPGTNCGLCGDDVTLPVPRINEYGGENRKEGTVAMYSQGGIIQSTVRLWNPHGGWMQWRVCEDAKYEITRKQECFNLNLLTILSASSVPILDEEGKNVIQFDAADPTRLTVNYVSDDTHPLGNVIVKVELQLPAKLNCWRCVLQFNYRAPGRGNETFRSCSQFRVVPTRVVVPAKNFDLLQNVGIGSDKCLTQTGVADFDFTACDNTMSSQGVLGFQPWNEFTILGNSIVMVGSRGCLNVGTDKGMTLDDNSKKNGMAVVPMQCKNYVDSKRGNQKWRMQQTKTSGQFQLVAAYSGRCLKTTLPTANAKSKFFQFDCDETDPFQLWSLKLGSRAGFDE